MKKNNEIMEILPAERLLPEEQNAILGGFLSVCDCGCNGNSCSCSGGSTSDKPKEDTIIIIKHG